jgi:hypothetical protein
VYKQLTEIGSCTLLRKGREVKYRYILGGGQKRRTLFGFSLFGIKIILLNPGF